MNMFIKLSESGCGAVRCGAMRWTGEHTVQVDARRQAATPRRAVPCRQVDTDKRSTRCKPTPRRRSGRLATLYATTVAVTISTQVIQNQINLYSLFTHST